MRWMLCVVFVVLSATPAHAKRVFEPGMAHACPSAKTWNLVTKCLERKGSFTLLRTLKGARLVELKQPRGDAMIDLGMYLYVEKRGEWRLGGQLEARGSKVELLDIQPVTINMHTGFRIDVGRISSTRVIHHDGINKSGILRQQRALFCNGLGWSCTEIPVNCEVLVHGNAVFVFRGTLEVEDNSVLIHGDRRYAGPTCAAAERIRLGWQPSIK